MVSLVNVLNIEDPTKLFYGILFLVAGQILGFFQLNLRYIYGFWENKKFLTVFIFSLPIGISFYCAWGFIMEALGSSAWSAKFFSFGISYLVFPILTFIFLNESMFTIKTILCTILSIAIICIQIKFT